MSKSQLNELNAPKLRFKGFDIEWNIDILYNLANIKRGSSPRPINDSKWFFNNSDTGWLRISDINGKYLYSTKQYLSNDGKRETTLVDADELIMSICGSICVPCITKIKIGMPDSFIWFKDLKIENDFFYYFLKGSNQFIKYGQPGSQINLNSNIIGNALINYPDRNEQTKIAKFFSLLDKQIELWERKLQFNELKKKYYLNSLFADTSSFNQLPKLRFKGFEDKWNMRELGEVSSISTGNKDVKDKIENGLYPFYVRSDKIERINKFAHDCEAILIPGDGRIGDIFHYINGKFNYHQRVYAIVNSSQSIKYLYYEFQVYLKKYLLSFSAKATVDSIRMPMLQKYRLFIPNRFEQEKISKFFSLLDQKMVNIKKHIELSKNKKQYFLSHLFI